MVAMAMTAACPLASTSRNVPAPQRPAATAAVALPGVICTRHVLAPLRAGSGFASAFRHHRQQQRRWQPAPSICSVASSSEPAPTQAQEAPAQQLALSSFSSDDEPGPSMSSDAASSTGGATSSSSGGISGSESEEGEGKSVKIDLQLPRRSLLVQFTCKICRGRSERLVNPVAWERGMVIAQCQQCDAWHKLADAANLVEEIRYADLLEEEEAEEVGSS